jgi:hypothetical protein
LLAHFEFSASSPRSAMRRAIRAGAAKPDISSVEPFRRTLLAAKSIVYTDPAILGPSTMNFQKVLDRLGIAKEMKAKSLLNARAATTPNAEIVARGEAELGIQLISEIVSVPGAELRGALPAELQIMNVIGRELSRPQASRTPPRCCSNFCPRLPGLRMLDTDPDSYPQPNESSACGFCAGRIDHSSVEIVPE